MATHNFRGGPIRPNSLEHDFALIIIIIGIITAFLAVPGARAQEETPVSKNPSITLQAQPTLEGYFKYGEWLPVWVYLENDGSNLNAEVRIRVTGGYGGLTFAVPVELPTASRKRLVLYVLPNNFSRQLDVQLVQENQLLASQVISIQPQVPINYLVGLLAPERGALSLINGIKLPGQERPKVLIDIPISELPERYEGLRSLDLLVINDLDTSSLTPKQINALQTWVSQGGRLVVGGGAGAQRTLSGLPESLLPFSPDRSVELDDVSSLEDFAQSEDQSISPIRVPGPFLTVVDNTTPANALVTQGEVPLVHEWPLGEGYVNFVALDLSQSPFDAWSNTTTFWEKLIGPSGGYPDWLPPDTSNRQQLASQMPYALSNLPILDLPSTKGLALLLGLYIVLVGPVNYLILRRQKLLHWAWVTIPMLTLIFSTAAFGLGYALHGTDIFLNKIAIINLQPDGKARIDSYMGLFSPARSAYEIEVHNNGLLSPMGSYYDPWNSFSPPADSSSRDMIFTQGDPSYVKGLNVEQWSMQSFVAEGLTTDFGLVIGDLRLEAESLVGTVRNESSMMLSDVVIILGRSFSRLGDLPANGQAQVNMDLVDLSEPNFGPTLSYMLFEAEFMNSGPEGPPREIEVRRIIIESVFDRANTSFKTTTNQASYLSALLKGPVLIGWLDEAPPEVRVSGSVPAQQTTALLILPLYYQLPVEGRLELPVGTIPGYLSVAPIEGGTCGDFSSTAVYIYRGEAIFEFTLPVEAQMVQVDNFKFALWSDSGVPEMPSVAMYNWQTQNWVSLEGISQGVNLIPSATQLANRDGKILVSLSTENNFQGGCYYLSMGLEGQLR